MHTQIYAALLLSGHCRKNAEKDCLGIHVSMNSLEERERKNLKRKIQSGKGDIREWQDKCPYVFEARTPGRYKSSLELSEELQLAVKKWNWAKLIFFFPSERMSEDGDLFYRSIIWPKGGGKNMYCECTCMHACKVLQNCIVLKKNSNGWNNFLIGGRSRDFGKDIFYISAFLWFTFRFLLFFIYVSHENPSAYTISPETSCILEVTTTKLSVWHFLFVSFYLFVSDCLFFPDSLAKTSTYW